MKLFNFLKKKNEVTNDNNNISESNIIPQTITQYYHELDNYIYFSSLQLYPVYHCTQKCLFCSTNSPFAKKHIMNIDAVIQYINIINDKGIRFETITLVGGEPFLYPKLDTFIAKLKENINYNFKIWVTTNGFWLDQEEKFLPPLSKLGYDITIAISMYSNYVANAGGFERVMSLIERFNSKYDRLKILEHSAAFFRPLKQYDSPQFDQVHDCPLLQCLNLTDFGVLYRCCVLQHAHSSPLSSKKFLELSEALTFDLTSCDADLKAWLLSPLPEACRYCDAHTVTPTLPRILMDQQYQIIHFNEPENYQYLQSGFSQIEAQGVWTDNTRAHISLPIKEFLGNPDEHIEIILFFYPYLHEKTPCQQISFYINDDLSVYDEWLFSINDGIRVESKILLFKSSYLQYKDTLDIYIHIPYANSPYNNNESQDLRILGIHLYRIVIRKT